LLGVFGLGSFVFGEGAAASAKDASADPGCDTQSSDRESSQACPIVVADGSGRWISMPVCAFEAIPRWYQTAMKAWILEVGVIGVIVEDGVGGGNLFWRGGWDGCRWFAEPVCSLEARE
jgi:hypothetical protein